mmetsp:Transcript_56112/g.114717  ORF Transcript_56112/g.114717 Transcript_56112/m.114717 type:complete len:352 (-) Transcript_56112:176-1231(-)
MSFRPCSTRAGSEATDAPLLAEGATPNPKTSLLVLHVSHPSANRPSSTPIPWPDAALLSPQSTTQNCGRILTRCTLFHRKAQGASLHREEEESRGERRRRLGLAELAQYGDLHVSCAASSMGLNEAMMLQNLSLSRALTASCTSAAAASRCAHVSSAFGFSVWMSQYVSGSLMLAMRWMTPIIARCGGVETSDAISALYPILFRQRPKERSAAWVAFCTAAVTLSCTSPLSMHTHVDPQDSTMVLNRALRGPPRISMMAVFCPSHPAAGANMGCVLSSSTWGNFSLAFMYSSQMPVLTDKTSQNNAPCAMWGASASRALMQGPGGTQLMMTLATFTRAITSSLGLQGSAER